MSVKWKLLLTLLIFALILLPPILLRTAPDQRSDSEDPNAGRLIILTPHNDSVKKEIAAAFRKYYREKTGKNITLDYRAPGGTSDIMRYIRERYKLEFSRYCENRGIRWDRAAAAGFSNDREKDPELKKLRKIFLESNVGIGVDLMYGGGVFDMAQNARAGFAVDAGIAKTSPDLLKPDIIPHEFGGEYLYDKHGRYYGTCLSTFGICYNQDRLNEMNDKNPPRRWSDLAQPRFYNNLVIADPSKSGSANKCFEIIIQQVMAERGNPEQGWTDGLNLIKRIVANASVVTDSAGKVVRDVSAGSAAAGMAIDTYGLTEGEWNALQFNGKQHFFYVTPEGGTAVSPDTVQLLRGAPNKSAAVEFIRFLISVPGQKIVCFKPGTPGGPVRNALRRPPIRRDLYDKKYISFRSDPDYNPYQSGSSFKYRSKWTGRYYSLLRVLIRILMLDCQDELKTAWRAIIDNGGPDANPEAMKYFNKLPFDYDDAAEASKKLSGAKGGALEVVRQKQKWRDKMRKNYLKAAEIARKK